MLYGPVVANGYGVCYNIHPDNMVFAVTAFKSEEETVAENFASVLVRNLNDVRKIFNESVVNGKV